MENPVLDQCPQCDSLFGYEEIDNQACSCCGWQAVEEPAEVNYYTLTNLSKADVKVLLGSLLKQKQSMGIALEDKSVSKGFVREQLSIINGLIDVIEKINT